MCMVRCFMGAVALAAALSSYETRQGTLRICTELIAHKDSGVFVVFPGRWLFGAELCVTLECGYTYLLS